MGTRGFIGRPNLGLDGDPVGVYHHWDSYPTALGATLFAAIRGHFEGDIEAALRFLIDDHPAGWSTINGADLSQPSGFEERGFRTTGTHCYCHGGRSEEGWGLTLSKAAGSGCEYAYVISPETRTMYVLSSYTDGGAKMVGIFGMGDEDATWREIGRVDLDGAEPDWAAMEEAA